MTKFQVYWTGLLLVASHRCTIWASKAREKAWSGNIPVHHERRSSDLSPLPKKVLLTFFLDMKGPILEHYQEKGQTVNSTTYSAMLKDKVKPVIHNKRR
jgi:hypothetical protein